MAGGSTGNWHLTEAEHQRSLEDDLIVTSSEWRVGHSSTPSTVWRPNAGHLDQALRQQEDPTTPPSRAFVTLCEPPADGALNPRPRLSWAP